MRLAYLFIFVLLGISYATSEWIQKTDLLLSNYEDEIKNLEAQNYTVKFVCNYLDNQTPKVIAVLDKDKFRGEVTYKVGLNLRQLALELRPRYLLYNPFYVENRVVSLCSYVLGTEPYFSVVLEKTVSYPYEGQALTADLLRYYVFEYKTGIYSMRLTHITAYVDPRIDQDLYYVVFEHSQAVDDWVVEIQMSQDDLEEKLSYYESNGYRVRNIQGIEFKNQTILYLALWEKVSLLSPLSLSYKFSMSKEEYDNEIIKKDHKPKQINSFTLNSIPRFNVIWQKESEKVYSIESVDNAVSSFMNESLHYGLVLSITKDERLVYNKAYGKIDSTIDEPLSTENSVKIGSISKTFTSISILKLLELGLLESIDQKVFGDDGILKNDFVLPDYHYANLSRITVRELLRHTSGIRSTTLEQSQSQWIDKKITKHEYLQQAINKKDFFVTSPGLNIYVYSNDGYVLLALVIEKLSGLTYEEFTRQNVLIPSGIGNTMTVSNTDQEPQRPREMLYTIGKKFNFNVLDSAGGFVARSQDIAKMLVRIDGLDKKPDIISSESLAMMLEKPKSSPFIDYGLGLILWNDGYGHNGATQYTLAFGRVYTNRNMTISVATNTGASPNILQTIGKIEKAVFEVNQWPDVDLFDEDPAFTTTIRGTTASSGSQTKTIFQPIYFIIFISFSFLIFNI